MYLMHSSAIQKEGDEWKKWIKDNDYNDEGEKVNESNTVLLLFQI